MCIGENISIERLDSEYDAVVLCVGSTVPKDIILEGEIYLEYTLQWIF